MAVPPPRATEESPWPVAVLNNQIKGWVERLGEVWVEGEITEASMKPQWSFGYITLRDTSSESSIGLLAPKTVFANAPVPLTRGQRVVCRGKPNYFTGRGELRLRIDQIRLVGEGELQARIDKLRGQLLREGLFDPARKKKLPYLPQMIGLITGRGSAAERDVLETAKRLWPEVSFRVINTAVQGAQAVPQIIDALRVLDADPQVDVIIVARGGGSVEDLLPFSEEALQRVVADVVTPVVSAIGHEPDRPILDDVADFRAATPTDAAKCVVPDAAKERQRLAEMRARSAHALRGWVQHQHAVIQQIRQRPVMANPLYLVEQHERDIDEQRLRLRRQLEQILTRASHETAQLRARVSALGPAATLQRGYAVVQVMPRDRSEEPQVVSTVDQVQPGSQLRIRVADGSIAAATLGVQPAD